LTILTAIQSLVQVAMALLIRALIDAALEGSPNLGLWALLLMADLVLQVVLHSGLNWALGKAADEMMSAMRCSLLKTAVYSADSRLQAFHSGTLLSRGMEDVRTVCDGVVNALPGLVGQLTRLVAAFAALVIISPKVALVLLAAALVALIAIGIMRPRLKKLHKKVREADEKVMSTMQEDLQKLELIQSLQAQQPILEGFDHRLSASLKEKSHRRIWTVGSNSILNIVSLLGTGALMLWGAVQVAANALSYGSLTSLLQLLSQFRTPVLSLSGLWTRFAAVEVAGERLTQLLQIPEEATAATVEEPTAIVFQNITFTYPEDDVPVLKDFSLRLELSQWNSLSGFSGRGKSTLFKLILGLYTPQEGSVLLETREGSVPCSAATRHLFAYVPQDYALFSGTVEENLLLVAPEASREEQENALEAACARFLFEADSLATHVGENNTGLSKGQLQRIAIARAILMDRKILLLDECTSALDADTEKQVLSNLRRLCPRAILVTHRPEALEALDGIHPITMEN
jgi:ATP-binding cassette subfamily B protein